MTNTDLLEAAWGIIANASGSNWDLESKEWKQAAERWRDNYFANVEGNDSTWQEQAEAYKKVLQELREELQPFITTYIDEAWDGTKQLLHMRNIINAVLKASETKES